MQPVAYAKIIPLPSLIKKLQGLANEVQPENNQAQLLPVIVGAFLGDPTLSSVSPDHSSTVIFFEDFLEKNATILGVFKLKPNSPIPAQIKIQGLSVEEIEGWTMVTNKPGLLEQINEWSSIISFAEWQPSTTIEFGWLLEEFHEEMSSQLIHGSLSKEMSPDHNFVINLFLEEFGNLEAIKFSLSLLEKEIILNLKVSARDGTELDKLFSSLPPSQNLKGENGVSQFVQSGGWMEGVMNINFSSHAAYMEHLLVKLEKGLKDKEVKQAQEKGIEPKEHVVGFDALAVFLHKDNPAVNLTIDQLKAIYGEGGALEKWSDLGLTVPGCPSDEIVRVSRQNNSGTYVYFKEAVLGKTGEYKLGSRDMHGSKDVVDLVLNTPCAIGYSGLAYATDEVKLGCIIAEEGKDCVLPSTATALDGTYPIARPLFMYTAGEPTGNTKTYLDWILSDTGQCIIAEKGYAPIRNINCDGAAAEAPAEAAPAEAPAEAAPAEGEGQ